MLTLKNLSFEYKIKHGPTVKALNNVNFSFKNHGLYFIVGKSGCGKSTLLNLLSGIDKVKTGDILVNNQSIKNFNDNDYDNYRNHFAGIIFQEFNLIETMTVYENIDLSLKLSGMNNNKELVDECLAKVDLDGYAYRYPNELSGGQKQRVSIARQLAKGSKVIIADEPTGSLDSENSKNVFEILKKLSKDTLIIVASHDLEFAETYGDEIITFVDGEINNVKVLHEIENDKSSIEIEKNKSRIPLGYSLKFAFKDIVNSKIKFIIASLLCFMSLAMVGLFISFYNYSSETAIAKTIINNGDDYYSVFATANDGKKVNHFTSSPTYSCSFDPDTLNYINNNYSSDKNIKKVPYKEYSIRGEDVILYYSSTFFISILNSVEDLDIYGFSLAAGSMDLDGTNCYITDYFAILLSKVKTKYIVDGKTKYLNKEEDIYKLIGSKVYNGDMVINVAGIINTDCNKYLSNIEIYSKNETYENFEYRDKARYIYMPLYTNLDYYFNECEFISLYGKYGFSYNNNFESKNSCSYDLFKLNKNTFKSNGFLLYKDSYVNEYSDLNLNGNQVIINLDAYNKIFNSSKKSNDYVDYNKSTVKAYPEHIGEKFSLNVLSLESDKLVTRFTDVEIVGVYFEEYLDEYQSDHIYFSNDLYSQIAEETVSYSMIDYKTTSNKSYLINKLNDLRKHCVLTRTYYSQDIYSFEATILIFMDVFVLLGILLMIISIIIYANYIATTINNRKKDIGIIRAVGGSRNNIFKLFFTEGLLFFGIITVIGLILSFIFVIIINGILTKEYIDGTILITYSPFNVLIIPFISFTVMFLATIFPIVKINKKTPVEIIRNN